MDNYMIKPELFTSRIKALVYGDPGSGKTFLAGTAQDSPEMSDVHFFNIDGGMMTLAERRDIMATDVRSVIQLEEELYKIANGDEKYKNVKTVVIDNVTELQTLNLEDIVRNELLTNKNRAKSYTLDEIFQEDYGKSTKQLSRILRGFRDLPINVIFIAHRKDKKRKGSDTVEESRPSLTDKLCTSVTGYMDFVWYLYTMEMPTEVNGQQIYSTHRFLLTQPYNGFVCKTRGTKFATQLGTVVQNPDMKSIMETYVSCQEKEI